MKKVFVLLLVLLCLAGALYALAGRVTSGSGEGQRATTPANVGYIAARFPAPTRPFTVTPTQTATPARCVVTTGLLEGRVNLRSCGSLACGVSAVLTEGESLTVLPPTGTAQPGEWLQVRIGDGVTGWVKGAFCEAVR